MWNTEAAKAGITVTDKGLKVFPPTWLINDEILEVLGFEKNKTGYSGEEIENGFYVWLLQIGNNLYLECDHRCEHWALRPGTWPAGGCEIWNEINLCKPANNTDTLT